MVYSLYMEHSPTHAYNVTLLYFLFSHDYSQWFLVLLDIELIHLLCNLAYSVWQTHFFLYLESVICFRDKTWFS